jgi:hypothetical protein
VPAIQHNPRHLHAEDGPPITQRTSGLDAAALSGYKKCSSNDVALKDLLTLTQVPEKSAINCYPSAARISATKISLNIALLAGAFWMI